jgi:predicted deacylase
VVARGARRLSRARAASVDLVEGEDREAPGHATVVSRSEQVIAAPLGTELAVMDVTSGAYFVLDDIANFVWSALDKPRRLDDLFAEIGGAYDVTPSQCEKDVTALIQRMRAQGLVQLR